MYVVVASYIRNGSYHIKVRQHYRGSLDSQLWFVPSRCGQGFHRLYSLMDVVFRGQYPAAATNDSGLLISYMSRRHATVRPYKQAGSYRGTILVLIRMLKCVLRHVSNQSCTERKAQQKSERAAKSRRLQTWQLLLALV